jgi:hypothetical protein
VYVVFDTASPGGSARPDVAVLSLSEYLHHWRRIWSPGMIDVLEKVIDRVRQLPEDKQRFAAAILEHIASDGNDVYVLSQEEERLLQEGIDDLDSGRIASSAHVQSVLQKYRL